MRLKPPVMRNFTNESMSAERSTSPRRSNIGCTSNYGTVFILSFFQCHSTYLIVLDYSKSRCSSGVTRQNDNCALHCRIVGKVFS